MFKTTYIALQSILFIIGLSTPACGSEVRSEPILVCLKGVLEGNYEVTNAILTLNGIIEEEYFRLECKGAKASIAMVASKHKSCGELSGGTWVGCYRSKGGMDSWAIDIAKEYVSLEGNYLYNIALHEVIHIWIKTHDTDPKCIMYDIIGENEYDLEACDTAGRIYEAVHPVLPSAILSEVSLTEVF